MPDSKHHFTNKLPVVRAMVMGANDGLISISALLVGLASANSEKESLFIVSIIGLLSGAISMAAGEFLSVSAQKDSEIADIKRESESHKNHPQEEHDELIELFVERGISEKLAKDITDEASVDKELLLKLHLKEELGFEGEIKSNPLQASLVSFMAFMVGGSVPVITSMIVSIGSVILYTTLSSIIGLVLLGGVSGYLGGSSPFKGALRVGIIGSIILVFSINLGKILG